MLVGMDARLVIPILLLASATLAGSETPPEGPPWKRDILEAQELALKEGKPVFFYFTKTY
jgi:hypothetical protein